MKGYVTANGYMGYVNGVYLLFASEMDYLEYLEDQFPKMLKIFQFTLNILPTSSDTFDVGDFMCHRGMANYRGANYREANYREAIRNSEMK